MVTKDNQGKTVTKEDVYGLLLELSKTDYGEPLPPIDDHFLRVWTDHYYRIARLVSGLKETSTTLEIGIGFGVLAVLLRRFYGCPVIATEHPSRGYLQSGEFRRLIEREGISIVAQDLLRAMPFKDNAFELVLWCDVLEHLPPAILGECLGEIRRITKRGGSLIVSTPNLARLPNRILFLRGRGINPPTEPRKVGETYDHIREYTTDEVRALLGEGFRIVRYDYGLIPFFNKRFNLLNSLFYPFCRRLGDEIYVLCEVIKDHRGDPS